MMRPYLLTLEQLRTAKKPVGWWQQHGLLPMVNLYPLNPFHDGDRKSIPEVCQEIESLSPAGWLLECWCSSADLKGPLTWLDRPDWETFLGSVRLLAASMRLHHGAGLIIDCEYYPGTESGHGGAMKPGTWPLIGAARRGTELASAIGPALTVGAMVWAQELARQKGLASFLQAAWKDTGEAHSEAGKGYWRSLPLRGMDQAGQPEDPGGSRLGMGPGAPATQMMATRSRQAID
jgi:hypothetical protein